MGPQTCTPWLAKALRTQNKLITKETSLSSQGNDGHGSWCSQQRWHCPHTHGRLFAGQALQHPRPLVALSCDRITLSAA